MAFGRSQNLRVVISGDASSLTRAFAQAEVAGNKFEKKLSGSMSRVGTAMRHLTVGAFAGAGFGLASLVKAGVDYEQQMAKVKAVTDATGPQFKRLGDLAKQLGKDTKFSAGQAAAAMYELGSAGFRADQMAKVLPGTLSLAAASNIELADAAEISANALKGFGLASNQSSRVSDVLAQAVAASSVEMKDLQLSLKYIGPVAKLTGQSFEDMIAAVELMGNAGIKGEQAGTSLRGAMVRLTKPTKMVQSAFRELGISASDLQGPKGLKPLPQIIAILEQHTAKLSKAQRNQALAQIFGTEALSGMAAVIDQGSKKLTTLAEKNRHAEGAAKRMATTMNNTVAGAFENFTGTVETAGITIFEKFQVPLRKGLLGAAKLINDFPATIRGKLDAANLLPAPRSRTNVIATMLGNAIASVPWGKIGGKIADGISQGVKLSGDFAKAVETGIGAALAHVNGEKMLSGLLRVVAQAIDALFSPKFWIDNFQNIFATVTIAIPVAKILRIPGAAFLFEHISRPVFRALARFGKGLVSRFGSVAEDGLTGFLGGLEKFAPRTAHVLLSVVTGSGRWLAGLPGKFRSAGLRAVDAITKALGAGVASIASGVGRLIGGAIRKLGSLVPDFVKAGARFAASLVSGLVRGLTSLPGKVGGAIKKGIGAIAGAIGIGEGIGKTMQPRGTGAASGLMGARSSLAPFASIGSRFGLHVSSGRRPGAITSSGNTSYHSTGEAIDEAGPPAKMLGFFNYMKARFGPRLAELIFTPGGAGIKNGKPYQYTGAVAADHFDHVHVAIDSGKAGVGDGLGRFTATSYGPPWGGIQGGGVTATGVNLKGNPHIYGIAADPSVIPLGSHVKVSPNPFGYTGAFRVFDTGGAIKGRRIDFYDWRGRQAQNSWGSRPVTISTDTPGAGGSRGSLNTRLQGNLDRLDALRNQLAGVPTGKGHTHERHALQAQIRSLVSSNRAIRGDIRSAPSAADIRAQQEHAGSRIVNRIAAPFFRGKGGIGALSRFASDRERVISDKDTEYGQAERRFGLTDEDLGTAAGRSRRTSELKELAKLKQAQLARQKTELAAVVGAVRKYDGLIKKLRGQLKGSKRATGATAARIRKRLQDYENRRIELAAQARSLGAAIEDTKLDLGDLAKEASDVASTPDTIPEAGPTPQEQAANLLDLIDLRERAGVIDSATANAQKQQVLQGALAGQFGALDERQQLQLMGDLRDVQTAALQAVEDNTSALRDLQKSIDDNTAFARSVVSTENASLTKSLADLISGQIAGYGLAGRALMPGGGFRARY